MGQNRIKGRNTEYVERTIIMKLIKINVDGLFKKYPKLIKRFTFRLYPDMTDWVGYRLMHPDYPNDFRHVTICKDGYIRQVGIDPKYQTERLNYNDELFDYTKWARDLNDKTF